MTGDAMSLQTVSPCEIDEQLARLHEQQLAIQEQLSRHRDTMHRAAGDRREYIGRRQAWTRTHAEVTETLKGMDAAGQRLPLFLGHTRTAESLLADEGQLLTQLAQAGLQIRELDEIYRADPWTRYFPCLNADGHIHASLTSCPTTRWSTEMGWTPQLSGKSVQEAVAELGPLLCSHCFPLAPVDWRKSKQDLQPKPCPGSGQAGTGMQRRGQRYYGSCPECGTRGQLTPLGRVGKHQPPAREA